MRAAKVPGAVLSVFAWSVVVYGCGAKIEAGAGKDGQTDAAGAEPHDVSNFESGPLPDSVAVILTEIMYAPVDEQADEDNHEFVEIYNRSDKAVALDGWMLTSKKGDLRFSFAVGTTLAPGQYRVVAKNRQLLAQVASYGLDPQDLLGDYEGELDNGGDTVFLRDASGMVVEAVAYNDKAPWPISADALGVSEDWLPAEHRPLSNHQYRGRSLERISVDFASGTPANWEASPLDGATPGKGSSVAGSVLPIVEDTQAFSEGGSGGIIHSADSVAITARFSSFGPVSQVQLEYFVDDVTKSNLPTTTVAMTPDLMGSEGSYRVVVPRQADNSVVRYRIRAMRDGVNGVAAPRATDPLSWFTYFVTPKIYVKPGVETKARTYHLFIRPADWTKLEQWIGPGREFGDSNCTVNPDWSSTVPATFVSDGKAYDVRVRYEGSRFGRGTGGVISSWPYPGPDLKTRKKDGFTGYAGDKVIALSWRIKFPRYDRFEGVRRGLVLNKMSQGCPGAVTHVESALLRKAGLPSYNETFGRLHINGGYYHYVALPEDVDETFLEAAFPGEALGDLFKNDGANNQRGPSAIGNFQPILTSACQGKYQPKEIYETTYPRQTFPYRPHDELVHLITDLAAARTAGSAAVRAYFMKYWDWESLLTIYVIRNWAGVWDDAFHNSFPYKRTSTGKWTLLQQDFEWDFGMGRRSYATWIAPFDANETLYLGWNSPDMKISTDCELANPTTGRCNHLGFNALKDAFFDVFRKEFDDKMRELTKEPEGLLSTSSVSVLVDAATRAFSVEDWMADPALKMCNVDARMKDMYTWTRVRNAKVAAALNDGGVSAPDDYLEAPIGAGGATLDWTKCQGGDQPGVSAENFCVFYEKMCGFAADGSRYIGKDDCKAKYAVSRASSCRAGALCFASNFRTSNEDYCRSATGLAACAQ